MLAVAGSVILIVVESPAERASINAAFSESPHHLVFAGDAADALTRYGEVKPDLILAPGRTRRTDGAALCRKVRLLPRGQAVPFLLVMPEGEFPALAEGCDADGVLGLPLRPQDIAVRLAPLLAFGRQGVARPRLPGATPLQQPQPSFLDVDTGHTVIVERRPVEAEVPPAAEASSFLDRPESALEGPMTEDLSGLTPPAPEAPLPAPRIEREENTEVGLLSPFHSTASDMLNPGGGFDALMDPADEEHTTAESRASPVGVALQFDRRSSTDGGAAEKTGSELDVLEEPSRTDHGRPELLEEPQISVIVPSPPDHRENSAKNRIIQEPARDGTPSGVDRSGPPREGFAPRGLDESQLGKRLAKRVRTMFQALEDEDPYKLLDLRREASLEAITRAYFELSLEFHPDRFFLLRSGDLKEKIYAIYRKISEAYDVLSDPRRRAALDGRKSGAPDAKRRKPELPPPTFSVVVHDARSKKFVELANVAAAEGDFLTARLYLHLAWGYEANNAGLAQALEMACRRARPTAPRDGVPSQE